MALAHRTVPRPGSASSSPARSLQSSALLARHLFQTKLPSGKAFPGPRRSGGTRAPVGAVRPFKTRTASRAPRSYLRPPLQLRRRATGGATRPPAAGTPPPRDARVPDGDWLREVTCAGRGAGRGRGCRGDTGGGCGEIGTGGSGGREDWDR